MKRARIHRLIVVVACSCGLGLAVACTTDYQKGLDDPNFGAPNALVGTKQPGPTSEQMTKGAGTGSGAAAQPACVQAGAQLVDGGTCAVSFKTILAAFKTASCQTAGSCHGGANPPNQPRIEPDDPTIWSEFAAFKLSNGKLYINPCSTDPTQSTIGCNVNKAAPCGSQLMPPGVGLPANVVTDIDTWLKCGAPNN